MIRSRTQQLLKIEKENENKDIKTKLGAQSKGNAGVSNVSITNNEKNAQSSGKQSSKHSGAKSKTLINNEPLTSTQQLNKTRLNATSTHQNESYAASTDTYVKSIGMFPNHKRLGPYMAPTPGPKPRLGHKQVKYSTKDVILPSLAGKRKQKEDLSLLSSENQDEACVLEIFTQNTAIELGDSSSEAKNGCSERPAAASISKILNSAREKSKSARVEPISPNSQLEQLSTCSDSSTYLNLDLDLCSLDSPGDGSEVYYMAPLLPVPTAINSSDSSITLERKFRNALNITRNSMEEDDIKVVKSVLKTDKRHALLKNRDADPSLFKDILKTQLREIIRNEQVIKSAIRKLAPPTEAPYGITEIADLLSHRKQRSSDRPSMRKLRKKQSSIQREPTEDSSPERRGKFISEAEKMVTLSDATDHQSAQHTNSYYEKRYNYSQQNVNKEKQEKRDTTTDAQKEYEEFLKSTLSFKQKVSSKKPSDHSMEAASHIDMQLNVVDSTEDERLSSKSKITRRPQVNVTFKNVKSVEKEILILRALGDRLEETMKRTISEPSLSELEKRQDMCSSSSILSLTKELQKIDPSIKVFPGRRINIRAYGLIRLMNVIPWKQHRAGYLIFAKGLRHKMGVINEFVIVSKTIDELKSDASSSFYIHNSGYLKCTSFEKLKEDPQVLLQNLKPKSAGVPFNLLDHDPIFFNSLLIPCTKTGENENCKFDVQPTSSRLSRNANICEGGDSRVAATDGMKKTVKSVKLERPTKRSRSKEIKPKEPKESKEPKEEAKMVLQQVRKPKEQTLKSSQDKEKPKVPTYLLGGDSTIAFINTRRNRIRRLVTPMPFNAFDEPKNNLLKKILVGVIQISIFMGLIMALTLPDIKC